MELLLNSSVIFSCTRVGINGVLNSSNSVFLTGLSSNYRVSVKISQTRAPFKCICGALFATRVPDNYSCLKCCDSRNYGRLIVTRVRDENSCLNCFNSWSDGRLADNSSDVEGRRESFEFVKVLSKKRSLLGTVFRWVFVFQCRQVMANEGMVNAGFGVIEQCILLLKNA